MLTFGHPTYNYNDIKAIEQVSHRIQRHETSLINLIIIKHIFSTMKVVHDAILPVHVIDHLVSSTLCTWLAKPGGLRV